MMAPPCMRCGATDRMQSLGQVDTDFGGLVRVHVCRRCGIVAVETEGQRPPAVPPRPTGPDVVIRGS